MNNNDMEHKAKELQNILEQFYSTNDNPKRKEIDTILNNYKAQSDSYEHVKYYLVHSDNQYVIWFSLSVIEEKVNKSWNTVSASDQLQTKNLLLEIFLNRTGVNGNNAGKNILPAFITSKLGQVIADIGRYEFEVNPQNYLLGISSIVRNPSTSIRGINLLQNISESFRTEKKVISQQKKNTLRKLLHLHSSIAIQVLTENLGQLFDQNAEKKFKHANLLAFQVGSPDTNTYTASFTTETKNLTKAVFDALISYFSWLPLNDLLIPNLFDILFKYLRLDNNSIPALECLNEIVSKNLVPKGFVDVYLIRIFHQIYSLLTDIVSNNGQQINQYHPDFISKFTQFIQLFVNNHLGRAETNPNFPIPDFLGLLFQYTFIQSPSDSFLQCISIWSTFLDYLITQTQQNGNPPPTKYTAGLLLLQSELIKRILYTYSSNTLSDLDDEDKELNENGVSETELESYIKKCIEVVAKVTELYPEKALENLYPLFIQNVTSFFCQAEENIKQGTIMDNHDGGHMVKDVTTILQLFGRLADQFVISFAQTFTPANFIFQKLLDMCSFTATNFTFKYNQDWEKLQVELLCTIRSFCYWLSEYGNQVRALVNQQPDFDSNISKLIGIIIRLFERNVPEDISIAAAKLLMSLAVISKPLNLFTQMDMLIGNIHTICNPLPTSVQTVIYPAISCTILLPPSNVNLSQQWDQRRPKYSPFIKGITSPFLEIPQIPNFVENKIFCKDEYIQRVLRVLKIVTAIIKSVPEASTAKGILHDGIQDTLQVTLGLFRIYINYPNVLEAILDFFFALFECLKSQVGVVFTQQTITTFLEILGGGDSLNQLLGGGNETGTVIIKKLLEILTFIVQTSGNSFESLLPSTIEFSMDKLYPIISNSTSIIKPSFFTLLYSILDNHWKHCPPAQINSILMAFQTTFKQNDVNLFKQNLDNFEKLNGKLKLYEKIASLEPVFGCSFISMFFDVLISETQSVHTDDIIVTIYRFSSLKFDKFFNEFLNSYLSQKNQLSNEQKQILRSNFSNDIDQPTFSTNITQFINDFSYFSFINS